MDKVLSDLEPKRVWKIFEEICHIPRPSKNEQKITKYILDFIKSNNLESVLDNAGNIVVRKPASEGKDGLKPVVLQSHIDMVGEKNDDVDHDFENDPIIPYIEDGWVKAKGTTLGADDGIGMAVQLAILESDTIEHGPVECLFTVDEETGLTGAFALDPDMLNARILLNLDSEDDGELFIGCAGGVDTVAKFDFGKTIPKSSSKFYKIVVKGLKGGHSGDDIDKNRGNAIKILNRILWNCENNFDFRLSKISGGNMHNAIPREASAVITILPRYEKEFISVCGELIDNIKSELKAKEPGVFINIEPAEKPVFVIDHKTQVNLLNALYACPHGIINMSSEIPGLVETSTNLASIKMTSDEIIVHTSQRSSFNSSKDDVANMVRSVFQMAGAEVKHTDGYPGWIPDVDSEILEITKSAYKNLFKEEPKVLAIHAGLECGLIGEKYPGMDMISYGPTISDPHSPDEKLQIDTVPKFWELTLEILKSIPSQ